MLRVAVTCLCLTGFLPVLRADATDEPNFMRLSLGMRYNTQFDKDTWAPLRGLFQYRTMATYSAGLVQSELGTLTLRGQAGTGPNYTVSWNAFASTLAQPLPAQKFNMRRIYLEGKRDGWLVQAGVTRPNQGDITDLGYDVDGWLRGGRIVAPVGEGTISVASGAIDHIFDPNAFQWWNDWNYFSGKIRQPLPWELAGFVNYEYLDDQNYLGAHLLRHWQLAEDIRLRGQLQAIHNFTTPSWAWGTSARLDIGSVRFSVEYTYINPQLGLRGALSDDFFSFGHRADIRIGGELFFEGFRWFLNTDVVERRVRFRGGFSYAFDAGIGGYLFGGG